MAGHKHALTLRLKAELLHCKKKMAWTWIRIDALHVDIIACLLVVLKVAHVGIRGLVIITESVV